MGVDAQQRPLTLLIPAYNPDERLLVLLRQLKGRFSRIVLVDDGSVAGKEVFERARPYVDAIYVHERNRGKGAALKTGFAHLGATSDVITADADGQHTPDDIAKIARGLETQREGLVLGVRSFVGRVPLRSRFGNWWTRWFFFLMTGLMVRDTQTGLRGIPAPLVPRVAKIPGERYEYEMAMLVDAKKHPARPLQIPIETVYLDGNRASHFNPLLDTIRIYRSLFQFCLSSVLAFAIDNGAFAAVICLLAGRDSPRRDDVLAALVVARVLSSHFNYFYNRFVVFNGEAATRGGGHRSYYGYFALVLALGAASYALTEGCAALLDVRGVAITVVKIVADTVLFFASYLVQKKLIFRPAANMV
ncbi:MAG: bifunctional glycosyltransferase family 2/GtrA family protein [Kiritimatiellae bacterium]|nr:bifunctional glycosyltransferase family 2/GtrA family protein [Kiritimatiellia bacterium]